MEATQELKYAGTMLNFVSTLSDQLFDQSSLEVNMKVVFRGH